MRAVRVECGTCRLRRKHAPTKPSTHDPTLSYHSVQTKIAGDLSVLGACFFQGARAMLTASGSATLNESASAVTKQRS